MTGRLMCSKALPVVVFAALALAALPSSASASALFSRLSAEPTERRYAPATATLPDGNVLLAGGFTGLPEPPLGSAEMFNPTTGGFERLAGGGAQEMRESRGEAATVSLKDGDVLIAGGSHSPSYLKTAELFNPGTDSFQLVQGHLVEERDGAAAALLPDGDVLIVDGCQKGLCGRTAEVFDPVTQTFSKLSSEPLQERYYSAAATLPNGDVLIAGGFQIGSNEPTRGAEIFNPRTEHFESVPGDSLMHEARGELGAVTLQDGDVLLVGGNAQHTLKTAELFNTRANIFEPSPAELATDREGPGVALLRDGRVLIDGGCQAIGCEKSAEILSVNPPSRASTARATRRTTHRARINAVVEAETNSTVYFQYGTSRRYHHRTRAQRVGGSTVPVSVSALLTRLTPGKRYHYRVVIENDAGKRYGADRSFVVPRRRRR